MRQQEYSATLVEAELVETPSVQMQSESSMLGHGPDLVHALAVDERRKICIYGLLATAFLFAASVAAIAFSLRKSEEPHDEAFILQVEKRVQEVVVTLFQEPVAILSVLERFDRSGLFPHSLDILDRAAFLLVAYSLRQEYNYNLIYYGSEEGLFMGYGVGWGTYREPANSYSVDDPTRTKYLKACVDSFSGDPVDCVHREGAKYIRCTNNCSLALCPDQNQTWCTDYEIAVVEPEEMGSLGYVPRTYYCHNEAGFFTQQPGDAVQDDGSLGNCTYSDGQTLVNRSLEGDYALCQGTSCGEAFIGGYRSADYDPRYRSWYMNTREQQKPLWSEPYPFFSILDIGMTYSVPYYKIDKESNHRIFRGVFGVDYTARDITVFLVESYGPNSNTASNIHVVIYEAADPNYFVTSSTGRNAAHTVLVRDPTIPCPHDAAYTHKCKAARFEMQQLEGEMYDDVFRRAYEEQASHGYPSDMVQMDVNGVSYVSRSSTISGVGNNLEWIVLVIS
ncbi:unknown protein [Seminavis robusta]|uniref:Uncharacterized protein n=1 Tax=Seminavis robusta TaxID=568900 RepID=A0A9N8DF80_9STRA|nr:unknown protein [Seminavis robusta]|eukprot:Sro96_g049540.1 n/a (506) ;mRNA; f:45243-46851